MILPTAFGIMLALLPGQQPQKPFQAFPVPNVDSNLEQHQGTLSAIKPLKGGKRRLTVKEGKEELEFTINRRTMVYQLNPRLRRLYTKGTRSAQIVEDSAQYRRSLLEMDEGQLDVVLEEMKQQQVDEKVRGGAREESERGAKVRDIRKHRGASGALAQSQQDFRHEEERRQERYGLRVRLKVGQQVIVYSKEGEDDTLLVLVVPGASDADQAAKQKELAAAASLKLIERLFEEGQADVAKVRLQKFLERYPDTKATKRAKDLLDSLQ
jgi:hypothetical protein